MVGTTMIIFAGVIVLIIVIVYWRTRSGKKVEEDKFTDVPYYYYVGKPILDAGTKFYPVMCRNDRATFIMETSKYDWNDEYFEGKEEAESHVDELNKPYKEYWKKREEEKERKQLEVQQTEMGMKRES